MGVHNDAGEPWLVVIDGPAGAGKSTIARRLAQVLGVPLLDTGAIYRALAWLADARGVAWDDEAGLAALAHDLPIRFEESADGPRVWLGETDVSQAIRTPHISDGASRVSALPAVRTALLDIQRGIGAAGCVAEGRDMGTVVFPHARHKFFLTADLRTRAARRLGDLAGAGAQPPSLQEVADAIAHRDARDSSRAVAPLRAAPDAIEVDTSGMNADAVLATVLRHLSLG